LTYQHRKLTPESHNSIVAVVRDDAKITGINADETGLMLKFLSNYEQSLTSAK